MEMLRINATREGALVAVPSYPDPGGRHDTTLCWRDALTSALADVPLGGRVIVLVHGYRFTWRANGAGLAPHCPQDRLYRLDDSAGPQGVWPSRAAWAHGLAVASGEGGNARGLCIGFGWDGRRGRLGHLLRRGRLDFVEVYDGAGMAGAALGVLLRAMAAVRPDLAPGFFAHSLGARVVLEAMRTAPTLRLGRALLLGAAEFVDVAQAALAAQARQGGEATVYHVLSRANDPFDVLFSRLAPRPRGASGTPLGHAGLGGARQPTPRQVARRWIDLQLDGRPMTSMLANRGIRLSRGGERISHWHFYTDPGAMRAWAAILHHRPGWDIGSMRRAGLDGALDARWSRLLPGMLTRPKRPAPPAGEGETGGLDGTGVAGA